MRVCVWPRRRACDFHGFGMADVSPKLARAFLDISATHYAEVGRLPL